MNEALIALTELDQEDAIVTELRAALHDYLERKT